MKERHRATYIQVGDKIRKTRIQQDLTQKELANKCQSVNRDKISKIENAREDYMFSTMLELCKALELEPKQLFEP